MKDKQVLNLSMHCTDVFAGFLFLHFLADISVEGCTKYT